MDGRERDAAGGVPDGMQTSTTSTDTRTPDGAAGHPPPSVDPDDCNHPTVTCGVCGLTFTQSPDQAR